MKEYPHCQAAFINAIREEGTKAEACDKLQEMWNELCHVRKALRREPPMTLAALEHEIMETPNTSVAEPPIWRSPTLPREQPMTHAAEPPDSDFAGGW